MKKTTTCKCWWILFNLIFIIFLYVWIYYIQIEFLALLALYEYQVEEIYHEIFDVVNAFELLDICVEYLFQGSCHHLYLEYFLIRWQCNFTGNQSQKSNIYPIMMHYLFNTNTINNKKCSLIQKLSKLFNILLFNTFTSLGQL